MPTDLFETRFVDCWVVNGTCGEYSDRSEWCIAVFLDQLHATELVAKLDGLVRKYSAQVPNSDWVGDERDLLVKGVNDELGFDAMLNNYGAESSRFYITKAIFGG